MLTERLTGRPSSRLLAGITALLAAAFLTACSSSSNTSPASGTSGSSGSGSSAAKQATAAKTAVAKYTQAPTKIDFTAPLKSKPPAGKTVVQLVCQVPQCQQIGAGAVQAAKALGWTVKLINYNDQDTSTFIAAMNQALQYHPVMVGITAVPQAVFQGEIAKYAKAGVPIDAQFTDAGINTTVVSNPGGHVTNVANGTMLGQWMIQDSGAQGHALVIGLPALPTTQDAAVAAVSVIKRDCSACKATLFNATLPEVGSNTLVPAIVAALQKDPSIKYVISGQAGFTSSLPQALKAAGISGVKLLGAAPTIPDEQQLQSGTAYAFAPLAFTYEGWQLVDAAARHLEKMPVPDGETSGVNPTQLITKANVGSGTPTGTLEQPANYRNQFKVLWRVG